MQRGVVQNTSELQQGSPIGDFNWATNFPGGEGDRSHSGHQACRWPLRDIASHVRILKTFTYSNIVPFWKTFVTRKMSTIFTSGLYSTFSNSTIMNKKTQVSHSKQKTILYNYTILYSRVPLPKSLCPPKYSVTNLTQPEIPQDISFTRKARIAIR